MPTIRTKSRSADQQYTSKGTDDEKDERGKRAVQATPKDQKQIKKQIGKDAGKPPPNSTQKHVKGDDESEVFDRAHALIALLRDSRDVDEHALALVSGGNDKHAPQKAAKPAPSKASKGK